MKRTEWVSSMPDTNPTRKQGCVPGPCLRVGLGCSTLHFAVSPRSQLSRWFAPCLLAALACLWTAPAAEAGKMSVLEGLVRAAMEESRAELRGGARLVEEAQLLRGSEELFENAVHQHEVLLRSAGRAAQLDEAALARRLARFSATADSETARTLAAMSLGERRFVVEVAETAADLSRNYPEQAGQMIRRLGPEGLSYTRVFGEDVAKVVLEEGPESLGVLRKGGRGAWSFFQEQVLPHKKKLAAAGVLAAFLANPDAFVDMAGKATDYAVREFSRAGVHIASGIPGSVANGIDAGVNDALERWGLNYTPVRWTAVAVLLLVAAGAAVRLFGWPFRVLAWPVALAFRRTRRP